MSEAFTHATVMRRETLEALRPRAGAIYADTTLGGGGHAEAILDASAPDGRLIGVDRDPRALAAARDRLAGYGARATLVHGEMAQLGRILADAGTPRVHGLVADLGVSSPQLDEADRGFSFSRPGPIDMRMDPTGGETALELIARSSERELADLIFQLGDERKSRRIARCLREAYDRDELRSTDDLRRAVARGAGGRHGRTDPATRTFQALRMAVNDEAGQLGALLSSAPDLLEDDGVAVVISFHSIEDRLVKRAFRGDARLEPLTKRPLVASEEERAENPRSRSAKLRAARRIPRAEASS